MALMTARYATGRDQVVVFDHGYHGGPLYFGDAGGAAADPVRLRRAAVQRRRRRRGRVRGATAARSRACSSSRCMGSRRLHPRRPRVPRRPAGADDGAAGAVLIFDEVMTSRLAVGGAQALLGITPDMTTLGKYLGGGLSFGAFGGRADLMATFDPARGGLSHAGTFNNNAFTMAVGAVVADRARRRRRPRRRERAR